MLKINVIAGFLYTDYTSYTWISIKINFGNSSRLVALILPLLIHSNPPYTLIPILSRPFA